MSDHDVWRDLAAAYVIGALDADDRSAFDVHLAGCERCRADVVELAPLPALLGRVDPAELDDRPSASGDVDAIVAAVRADVAALDRSRRRWRRAAGVAAAAVVAVVGVSLFAADPADDRGDDGESVELAIQSSEVSGEVVADARAWGTYVHVSVRDLPPRDGYELWIVDTSGHWSLAGTWAPTPSGAARLGGSSEVPLTDIERVVVTSSDRADEVFVAS